jgi:hypothetical protein
MVVAGVPGVSDVGLCGGDVMEASCVIPDREDAGQPFFRLMSRR